MSGRSAAALAAMGRVATVWPLPASDPDLWDHRAAALRGAADRGQGRGGYLSNAWRRRHFGGPSGDAAARRHQDRGKRAVWW